MTPTLEEVIEFVRDFTGLKASRLITKDTKLDADLGLTGDDGDEFLQEASKRLKAVLSDEATGYRSTFSLADDEYLFHSEGFDPLGIAALFRPRAPKVRDLSVGELHAAISNARRRLASEGDDCGEGP